MDEAGMGGKFNAQECVRMDSLKCVSKPQVNEQSEHMPQKLIF